MIAVDYFAGAGGWTTGAEQAGVHVAAAVNHWARAVETHRTNHPETLHVCQDAALIDPRELPRHDLFLASPACQGHSRARGVDKPHHDASRATAWIVIDTVQVTRPKVLAVENVPEFLKWALFPTWREALERLGYRLAVNLLDASEFGVPQERRRMVITGTLDHRRDPTIHSPKLPRIPASTFLDWDAGRWSLINRPGRASATLAKIEAGRARYGDRFLIAYYGSTKGGRSVARPIGTITTCDRYALIRGNEMRMLSIVEAKAAMGFPASYILTGDSREQMKQLGNAVCPPKARHVIEQLANLA